MNTLKSVTQFKGIALFDVQTWILIFIASLLQLHSANVDIILDCNSGPSLFALYIHIVYEHGTQQIWTVLNKVFLIMLVVLCKNCCWLSLWINRQRFVLEKLELKFKSYSGNFVSNFLPYPSIKPSGVMLQWHPTSRVYILVIYVFVSLRLCPFWGWTLQKRRGRSWGRVLPLTHKALWPTEVKTLTHTDTHMDVRGSSCVSSQVKYLCWNPVRCLCFVTASRQSACVTLFVWCHVV